MKLQLLLGVAFCIILQSHAQNSKQEESDFDSWLQSNAQAFDNFNKKNEKSFNAFLKKINKEYADFLRNPWKEFKEEKPVPKPKDETVPPVVVPKDEPVPVNPEPKPVPVIDVVPVPKPEPQPKPIKPIEEVPVTPVTPALPSVSFSFFGTTDKVRIDKEKLFRLYNLNENAIADAWLKMSEDSYTNLIHDCLELRQNYRLCDWAYLMMLRDMAESVCGRGTNESVLLTAYVYCQSGYQMRLAIDAGKLCLLVASRHEIFNQSYFNLDGTNYYPFLRKGEDVSSRVYICTASFPKEKKMSLLVPTAQDFSISYQGERTIRSERYPNVVANIKVNQNLMSFYNTYPTSMIDDNIMTRWAMYANTPLAKDVKEQLYPQLRPAISGKSQIDAVNILLNWVQTGFKYEFDDKVWGGDRAFFAEESLNYPYCDCEDRSILFSRLVRDLVGLKCILVFYPGHLATAVRFTEPVNGDYIQLNGQRYIVSDPTYIGAPVGMTMPDMNNQKAKVILLE